MLKFRLVFYVAALTFAVLANTSFNGEHNVSTVAAPTPVAAN